MRKPLAIKRDFMSVRLFIAAVMLVFVSIGVGFAQTSAFSYQGRLAENGVPSSATYTMKFRLYDALTAGNQIGSEITLPVTITGGIFTVSLDFGPAAFPASASRWLEIQVATTTLTPRQQLLGSPFAVRTLSSNQSDLLSAICNPCVTDSQVVGISGIKVTGSVANADHAANADSATNATTASSATNALALGGVAASNYLQKSGGTITGSLSVNGVISGDGSGLTNLPNSGFTWFAPGGVAAQAQPNKGYHFNSASEITVTLPTTPNPGDVVRVSNGGTGGIRIAQNANQSVVQDRLYDFFSGVWDTILVGYGSVRALAASSDGTKVAAFYNVPAPTPTPTPCDQGPGPCSGNPTPTPTPNPTPTGIKISTDSGATWTGYDTTIGRTWSDAAMSADGTKIVATVNGGQIYTSTDTGATWTPRDSNRAWKAVASSSDGTKLVAIVTNGQIYTSIDSGVSWTPRDTTRNWVDVTSSSDGTKLAAALNQGFIYTSTDSGATWTPRQPNGSTAYPWLAVASSADGAKLVATSSLNGQTLYISVNSGQTWTTRGILYDADYDSVAMTADGDSYLLGGTFGHLVRYSSGPSRLNNLVQANYGVAMSSDGAKLYAMNKTTNNIIAPPARAPANTSVGPSGYLTNSGQLSNIELQYVGNGEFVILGNKGTIVTH